MNYYDCLEIEKTATADEIKKAYRTLAKKYHPDQNNGDKAAEERFKKINEAYTVLSDPEKRRLYDSGFYETNSNRTSSYSGTNYGGSYGNYEQGNYTDPFQEFWRQWAEQQRSYQRRTSSNSKNYKRSGIFGGGILGIIAILFIAFIGIGFFGSLIALAGRILLSPFGVIILLAILFNRSKD